MTSMVEPGQTTNVQESRIMRINRPLSIVLIGTLVCVGGAAWLAAAQTGSTAATETAQAQPRRPILNFIQKHFKRAGQLRSQLNLTDEQRTAVRGIVADHKVEMISLFKDVSEKRQALRKQVLAQPANEQAIRTAADDLGKSIGDTAVKASAIVAELKTHLTPEQLEKIKAFRSKQQDEFSNALEEALGQ